MHAPTWSVPAGAPLHVAQTSDAQEPMQASFGAQASPFVQISQGSGGPGQVLGGQSFSGTVLGGQTQVPFSQIEASKKSEPQPCTHVQSGAEPAHPPPSPPAPPPPWPLTSTLLPQAAVRMNMDERRIQETRVL